MSMSAVYTPPPNGTRQPVRSALQYRRGSIWLSLFYLPLLVIPWIITCVLMFRPVGLPSYINQVGGYYVQDVAGMGWWFNAIDTISKIAGVIAVPIASALLASHRCLLSASKGKPEVDFGKVAGTGRPGMGRCPSFMESNGKGPLVSPPPT
ncbi:hypothetical protein B0T17DRAFT_629245 [Bombardia bombarda]|uniref:Uncharacterized protein n=1 Tax=Bombardia bombarda TaxID=252184 RepID=A0AA39TKL3_9PEZI|nr:hypothetical protein B0T17DRAFT_629245 [Bombardia bombarda]